MEGRPRPATDLRLVRDVVGLHLKAGHQARRFRLRVSRLGTSSLIAVDNAPIRVSISKN